MVLQVGGRGGGLAPESEQIHRIVIIRMVLKVDGRGGGWLQNHKKCKGPSSFSWFWKWVGQGRMAPESEEMLGTVIIFIVLEVGGRGAAGSRVIRNA